MEAIEIACRNCAAQPQQLCEGGAFHAERIEDAVWATAVLAGEDPHSHEATKETFDKAVDDLI
jgi:hypothetical protein